MADPDHAGTLETIAVQLTQALKPLEDRLAGGQLVQFAGELGVTLPPSLATEASVAGHATAAVAAVADMLPVIADLIQAIDDDDENAIASKGVDLIRKLVTLIGEVQALADGIHTIAASGGLTPEQTADLQDFAGRFAVAAVDYLLVEYIRQKCSCVISALNLFGVIDDMDVPGDPSRPFQPPFRQRKIYWSRMLDLFTKPGDFLKEVYDFGNPTFDGTRLFPRVQRLLDSFQIPTLLIEAPGQPPVFEAFVLRFVADPTRSPPGLLMRMRLPATQDFTRTYRLSDIWALEIDAKARFEAGVELALYPPMSLEFHPPTGNVDVDALLSLVAQRSDGNVMTLLGDTGGSGLFLQKFALGAGATGSWSTGGGGPSIAPEAKLEVDGGRLVVDFSNSDGFIKTIAGGVKLDADMGFSGFWSPATGLRLEGSAAIELDIPAHLQLGPLEIVNLYLRAGLASDGSIPIELSGAFDVMLGPLQASVDRIGLKITVTFPDGGGGNLGPANMAFDFKPPNGVGLAIDTGVVEGGGYLYFDFEKEEYAGALELMIADWLKLTAVGLVTTRMPDGSKGFSLLIIITAEFGTGIQLGMGFVLVGVGGLLGVNRTVRLEQLADGVRTGAVNEIMFPENVIANAPKIISDLRALFPPQEGVFLIGPMAKIGYGSPPLITLSLGVIIEIPPGNIAILGVLRCILPTEDAAILKLQIAFVGAIEWDKKRLWFFAGLFDSKVLTFTLEGEMGLLFGWGDDANFVISVGGFHPRFQPPPLPFPTPKRLAISILDEDWGRIRVEAYFAITTNTVQFGCAAELHFDFSVIAIDGGFHFDALFQFSPFYFSIDLGANVSLSVFGAGIFSISLELTLEGPTPWHAKGTGSISFFFFSVSASFDQTWGEQADTTLPPVDVFPVLAAELAKDSNWSALPPATGNLLVSLRVADGHPAFVLHPVGTLRVTQRAVPLSSTIELLGTQKPDDATRFSLDVTTPGLAVAGPVPEQFAPAQFHKLTNDQKLTAPAFEAEQGGIDIRPNAALASSLTARRTVRYEEIVIDTNARRSQKGFTPYAGGLFNHFLGGNSAARSPLSSAAAKLRQPFTDFVEANGEAFGVAHTDTNALMGGTQLFGSYQAAKQHMDSVVAADPSLANKLHVLPGFEIQEAA